MNARALLRRLPLRRALLWGTAGLGLLVVGPGVWRAGFVSPEPTLLLRDRNDLFLGEVALGEGPSQLGYWRLPAVPPRVAAATIAVEDRRFAGQVLQQFDGLPGLTLANQQASLHQPHIRDGLGRKSPVAPADWMARQMAVRVRSKRSNSSRSGV